MSTTTTRNGITKPAYSEAADIGVINTNMDLIDASFAKCNWVATADPLSTDYIGYVVGSMWFNVTDHHLFMAEIVTVSSATWREIYPQGASAHTSELAPTVDDDSTLGYVIGSVWVRTTNEYIYVATTVDTGAAHWKLVYPQNHSELIGLTTGDDHTQYVLAAGTRELTGDWDAGDTYGITAKAFTSTVSAGTSPLVVTSNTKVDNLNCSYLNGTSDDGFIKQTLADNKGDIIVASGSNTWALLSGSGVSDGAVLAYDSTSTNNIKWSSASGGAAFWSAMPGTPTQVSAHKFTITDSAPSTNNYQYAFGRGTLIKWTETSTVKIAMVTLTSLTDNTVSIYTIGDDMASIDGSSLKYCLHKAEYLEWILPGSLAVGADYGRRQIMPVNAFPLQVEAFVKAAGATNATTFDVLAGDGIGGAQASIMASTTSVSIATATYNNLDATGKYGVKANAPQTPIAANYSMSVDITGVSTTAPVEAYIKLWYMPRAYLYRS
jgi:hypothetical protein